MVSSLRLLSALFSDEKKLHWTQKQNTRRPLFCHVVVVVVGGQTRCVSFLLTNFPIDRFVVV